MRFAPRCVATVITAGALLAACGDSSVVGGDGGAADAGNTPVDVGLTDVGMDAGPSDAGPSDAGLPDVGFDAGPADTGPVRCTRASDCAGDARGPACDTASGACVACTPADDRCPSGQYCTTGNACSQGCRNDEACASSTDGGTTSNTRCDPASRQCVACVTDEHCAPGTLCVGNVCVMGCNSARPCARGQSCCEGACLDLQSSIASCGACGNRCTLSNAAPACTNGTCTVATCTAPFDNCDNNPANGCETNLQTDTAHCGACNAACAARANTAVACTAGACQYTCTAGFADCDGNAANGCETDTRTSTTHCGACNRGCSLPNGVAACVASVCTIARCVTGFDDCDANASNGCETDTRTAVSHCGGCGMACAGAPNAVPACTGSACAITCTAGFADCDGNATNGCEADTRTSSAHCGRCGGVCALANAASACMASTCSLTQCSTGFGNCDGDASNGCEANTQTSLAHCGQCGRGCALANATSVCAGGVCGIGTCNTGFGNCDNNADNGCEVDTRTSVAHCGACGTACAAGGTCAAGVCTYLRSCQEIRTANPSATSGTYTIDPDGSGPTPALPVRCSFSGTEGWTMVYKLTAGVAGEPTQLWNGGPVNDTDPAFATEGPNSGHYVSRLLGLWNSGFTVTQARVDLFAGGTREAFVTLNAAGSTRTNWYAASRLVASTWTDIASQGTNFFQIQGAGNYGRHWFINRNYGGCPADVGWLVVNGSSETTCDWSVRLPYVSIMYARGTTVRNWNDYANIGIANVMAVYVR